MKNEDKILRLIGETPRTLKDLSVAIGLPKDQTETLLGALSSKIKPVKITSFNGRARPIVLTRYELT
jgi:hypothetical protein